MDPITTAVATKAATDVTEVAKKQAEGFLSAVLREPGEALGGLFADKIRERRHSNLIKIAARAKDRLETAGVSPNAVPLSIIHPMLEAASLEEEPSLREIWANLLANAADHRGTSGVLPSFPAILKELTARDVKFLDALFTETEKRANNRLQHVWPNSNTYDFDELEKIYAGTGLASPASDNVGKEMNRRSLSICMDTLMRHQLLEQTFQIDEALFERGGSDLLVNYSLTDFGMCFVEACQPPR